MSEKKTKLLRKDVARKTGRTLMKKGMRRLRRAYHRTPWRERHGFDVQPIVKALIREDVARALKIMKAQQTVLTAEQAKKKLRNRLARIGKSFKNIFRRK